MNGEVAIAPAGEVRLPETAQFIDTRDVARSLQISPRSVRNLRAAGLLPAPVFVSGRIVRWARDDFVAWIKAGCPSAVEWQHRRTTEGRARGAGTMTMYAGRRRGRIR